MSYVCEGRGLDLGGRKMDWRFGVISHRDGKENLHFWDSESCVSVLGLPDGRRWSQLGRVTR